MKEGDLVRFVKHTGGKSNLGLLLSYEPWQKIAIILYASEVLRIHSRYVTKAGRRDFK